MEDKKYTVWVSGSFYALTAYGTDREDCRKRVKESCGREPYHIEETEPFDQSLITEVL